VDLSTPRRWLRACVAYVLLPCVGFASGASAQPLAQRTVVEAVPQARVDPQTIVLPVVDGSDLRFRRLSTAQGLSQTRVAQVLQDDQGFLWFGTQYGLNRFDGYTFKVYAHDAVHPESLSGAFVHSLFKDRSGALWVGTDQFLDRFDRATETFTHYHVDARNPIVIHISEDDAGMLWLATGQGLYRLEPATGRVVRFGHDPAQPRTLSSNDVKSTGEDRHGTFWVANGEGLDAFDRTTGTVTLHIPLRVSVLEFSFHEDRHGTFWIVFGSGNGLAVFDRATHRLTHYSFDERSQSRLRSTGVDAILEDRDGTVWLGTMGSGLLKYDRAHRRWISYRNDPADLESLAEDRVIALFEDREGNIWTGLHARAPNSFTRRSAPFERIRLRAAEQHGLGESLVNVIYEDRRGFVWLGTGGALHRIDRESGEAIRYEPAGRGVDTEVLTILEDRSGMLWIGTVDRGLIGLDVGTGRFRAYRSDPADSSSISSDIVNRLFIDHAGTIWAGTLGGLNRFDVQRGRFTSYKQNPIGRIEQYFAIAEDRRESLWLAGTSGLVRFKKSTAEFTVFQHDPNDPRSLSNNEVNTVFVDRSDTIWVGTHNGLNALDLGTGTFTTYSERNGLSGNYVDCILDDASGALWMSSNRGMSRFDPVTKTFKRYSTADGLPGDDLTGWHACFKNPAGRMYFGGFAGAVTFRAEDVVDDTYIPAVVLTDFQVSGNDTNSPLGRSITSAESVTLSQRQNRFAIEFSALSFRSPATNRYRYMLEGLDQNWHEAGSDRRLVSYTTLPAGVYRFRVQAATSRGPWGEPGTALRIEVLPPWWNTWWLRTTYGALTLLAMYVAYHYRLRILARQFNMRLEERVGERTRIARDLHDSLLQGFQGLMFRLQAVRNMLPAHPTEAMHALDSALDRGDKAIAEGRDAVEDLRSAPLVGTDLIQSLATLGEQLTPDGGPAPAFAVLVEGKPRALNPTLRDEIYRIAREALRNAFNHANAGRIEAEVSFGDASLSLRVRDDGSGIDAAVRATGTRAGHWGLTGMRERAKSFGGRLEVWSDQGAGTEVELRVPAHVAYRSVRTRRWLDFLRHKREPSHES